MAQRMFHTEASAQAFYNHQFLTYLNPLMRDFIARQESVWIATADRHGHADCSVRFGPPGFVQVLDEKNLVYPEYRGNGVMASIGNIIENPNIGMLFIDFFQTTVGLHVNGKAHLVEDRLLLDRLVKESAGAASGTGNVRLSERWIKIEVEEAYIHCSKHVPRLKKLDKTIHWGTDDSRYKGGDPFQAKACERPWKAKP